MHMHVKVRRSQRRRDYSKEHRIGSGCLTLTLAGIPHEDNEAFDPSNRPRERLTPTPEEFR
jgi:hypothetical protein